MTNFKMRSGNKTSFKEMGSSPIPLKPMKITYDMGEVTKDAMSEFDEMSAKTDKKSPVELKGLVKNIGKRIKSNLGNVKKNLGNVKKNVNRVKGWFTDDEEDE